MDNAKNTKQLKFGLVGRNISYSFSRGYFADKFKDEKLPHTYVNFDLQSIKEFSEIIKSTANLKGLNVTIPYKEQVIPLLDNLDKRAEEIGAVNTIKIHNNKELVGYNTDYYGFKNSLTPHLKPNHNKALILGTGGASKAIAYALKELEVSYAYVSRSQKKGVTYRYSELTENIISEHTIIINCTPIGTFPNIEECPNIPYNGIDKDHILFDLIYNPEQTKFLSQGKQNGAVTINGLRMLQLQAEKAWDIWQTS